MSGIYRVNNVSRIYKHLKTHNFTTPILKWPPAKNPGSRLQVWPKASRCAFLAFLAFLGDDTGFGDWCY